jgi:hypothetical protein
VADIFISYSTNDRPDAAQLAAFLQEQGYSVWWDRELAAGQQFNDKVAQALADCRVAIVIWTNSSIKSRWVLGEAETAAGADKLVPVRADGLSERELPVGFRALHTIPSSDRAGLLRALKAHFDAPRAALSRWDIVRLRLGRCLHALRRWMTPGKAAIAAIVIAVAAYFAVVAADWMTIKDSMEPSDFRRHLATFPVSPFTASVRAKLAGVDEWESVKSSKSIAELQDYTEQYRGSIYYQYARLRLTRLQTLAAERYQPVFADSSRRELTPDEINALDCERLWTARNEIFYSLGFCFLSDAGINAFRTAADCPYNNCKLISKFNSLTFDIASPIENNNSNALLAEERKKGCRRPPSRLECTPRP